jgi:predicted negative regulator of RcsB-dependent stress response
MARHPTARRVRRADPTSDDVFVERVLETSAWAKENTRLLVIGTVVLVVALLGILYYRSYTRASRSAASVQLTQIRQTSQSGNEALAIRDLETFLTTYGGTPSADEARLLLGQAYLDSDQAQKAVDVVIDEANDLDAPMGVQAAFLLASSYEALAKMEDAERTYLRIAGDAPFDYQKVRGLDAAARLKAERGDNAGAVQIYDRVLGLLPEGDQDRQVFEMRRAESNARVQAAPAGS